MTSFDSWGPSVLEACYRAADAILDVYEGHKDMNVEVKSDNSPVTAADHAAHAILDPVLTAAGFPVLSKRGGAFHLQSVAHGIRFGWSIRSTEPKSLLSETVNSL